MIPPPNTSFQRINHFSEKKKYLLIALVLSLVLLLINFKFRGGASVNESRGSNSGWSNAGAAFSSLDQYADSGAESDDYEEYSSPQNVAKTLVLYSCLDSHEDDRINTAFFLDFGVFSSPYVDFLIVCDVPIEIPKNMRRNVIFSLVDLKYKKSKF